MSIKETVPMSAIPATDLVTLTRAGRADLEQELWRLRTEHLPALTTRLAEAREDPAAQDEDAGLLELQEEQQRLERRAISLERLLAAARDIIPEVTGLVALGSLVEIEEDGEREAYQLVDPREASVSEGRISIASPVGQALLGHRVGDVAVVPVPDGERYVRVVAVS
jgi:transcription elongation factor GreA